MTQKALDEFVGQVQRWFLYDPPGLDANVCWTAEQLPALFARAVQDPRYLAFCEEQDRKEETPQALLEVYHVGFKEIWYSDGRHVEQRDHGKATLLGMYDVDCAINALGWRHPPGTFEKITVRPAYLASLSS